MNDEQNDNAFARSRSNAGLGVSSGAEVWTVEADDYDSFVTGIYSSFATAVAAIKAPYIDPYIVEWQESEKRDEEKYILTGIFRRVEGYCGDGPSSWVITRWIVDA